MYNKYIYISFNALNKFNEYKKKRRLQNKNKHKNYLSLYMVNLIVI